MDAKVKVRLLPSKVETIRLDLIHRNPNQPRQVFNEEKLKELAANIVACGYLLYAILVRPHPKIKGHYEIVAGERRWRALKIIGVEEFEFHVAEGKVPSYLISLIENDNREDLNPIDEAEAFQKCMEEENMSVMELAKFTGKHFVEIYRALRLLKLPKEVKELIRQGKLRKGAAHHLVQFRDYAKQIELARRLIAGEDPPEIDEEMSRSSARSESMIEARLPTTVAGLIRRMLRFRRDSNSAKFVIKAFLNRTKGERLDGWRSFTKDTRDNFVAELEKLVPLLQELLRQMKDLPETRQRPSGAAAAAVARKETAKAVVSPVSSAGPYQGPPLAKITLGQSRPPPPREEHVIVMTRSQAPPEKKYVPPSVLDRVRMAEIKTPPGKGGNGSRQISDFDYSYLATAKKVVVFMLSQIRNGERNLIGKGALSVALGNGLSVEDTEEPALRSLKLMRSLWFSHPEPGKADLNEFMQYMHMLHKELGSHGCANFDDFINIVRSRDNSPDPVNIGRL